MEDDRFLDLCFISILAFQFHPKNEMLLADPQVISDLIENSMAIALQATAYRKFLEDS